MKMNLPVWANIAEIVSGIAVVITLIFLILGIRENTEITRAVAYDRNIDALNAIRTEMIRDSEIARRWLAFERGEADGLEGVDRLQLSFQINVAFQHYEKAFFNHKYGVLGDSEWTRYERYICINLERLEDVPDLRADMKTVVTNEFFDYMGQLCRDDD